MTQPRLQIVRRFPASPERVFAACSQPAAMGRWFGPRHWRVTALEADLRVGGLFRFTMVGPQGEISAEGVYERIEPPRHIVHSWQWSDDQRISRVTFLIEPDGSGTRLTFTHEGLADQASVDSHHEGWSEALDKLAEELAAGGDA